MKKISVGILVVVMIILSLGYIANVEAVTKPNVKYYRHYRTMVGRQNIQKQMVRLVEQLESLKE